MLLSRSTQRDKKALYFIAFLLMLIAVVMTGSRGGLIGTFAVVMAVLGGLYLSGRETPAESGQAKVGPTVVAGAGVVLVIVAGVVAFLGGADPLVRGIGLQSDHSDPTSGRMHFWSVAWKIFLDHPIAGAGFDAFGVAFTKYDTWNGYFRVEQAHNDYLQLLADGGILAFACVAAFIFLFVRLSVKRIKSSGQKRRTIAIGALAGCCGILVHSVFDFPLRTPSNSYFFLLLAALATVEYGGRKAETKGVEES
jgi:O-antigen ligase